jgi:hypothetical protein
MESISSIKIIAGAFFSASSKAFLKLDSESPLKRKKKKGAGDKSIK